MTAIFEKKKSPKALINKASGDLVLAGAEGLEPSARGFGAARKPIIETI